MRLVSFGEPGREQAGVVREDRVIPLHALDPAWVGGLKSLLSHLCLEELRERLSATQVPGVPLSEVRLRPPVPDAGKVICVGLNYVDHAEEQGRTLPETPLLFAKASSALTGPHDDVVIPQGITHVDYEAELACVVGKGGRDIPQEQALEHVAGYMVLNDVSARKLQSSERQWFRAKSMDTFAPCGPALITTDEIPDPHALDISLELNGEVRQSSNTRNLHFRVDYLLAYLSRTMTLEPGDILSTGTPGGVGIYSDPPVFLKDGDEMVTRIQGLGELRNRVRQA
ncbi:MAG: FAA hydrolase family protein [Acidobacteria bacterium]|nr:MAG: FAA hydrolase family protein [Acidobacteriota bacterium]